MHCKVQEDLHQSSLESIVVKFTHERQRSTRRAINISLAELVPLESCHFDLAPSQFRDGLTIRYQRHLPVYLSSMMDVVQISRCNMH